MLSRTHKFGASKQLLVLYSQRCNNRAKYLLNQPTASKESFGKAFSIEDHVHMRGPHGIINPGMHGAASTTIISISMLVVITMVSHIGTIIVINSYY